MRNVLNNTLVFINEEYFNFSLQYLEIRNRRWHFYRGNGKCHKLQKDNTTLKPDLAVN